MMSFLDLRSKSATLLCAVVFFLASADMTFTIRTNSVNVRFACLPLLAGLVVWAVTRTRSSVDSLRSLAIAWLPFLALYFFAAATSDTFAPTTLKLGWFAFNFVVAYAWTALFDHRDVVRAYFLSFLVIAAIITIDFMTGFTRGPDHMIGYGQANGMVPGMMLFRPHAFYYEPSFAASSLALAWALALTRMRDAAPNIATALVIVGAVALFVMTSRTGWLYATVAGVAIFALRFRLHRPLPRGSLMRTAGAAAAGVALLLAVFGLADNRHAFNELLGKLGFGQAFERVCPRIAQQFPSVRCLSGEERRQFLGESQPMNPDDTTEGMRLVWLRTAVATLAEHPWLGVGVGYGSDRSIAPAVVANVWLEVAHEAGLLALLAFAFGIGYTLRWGRVFEARHRDIMIVLALWFLIAWQFIETFPRLDMWIAFWVVLVWTRRESEAEHDSWREEKAGEEPAKGVVRSESHRLDGGARRRSQPPRRGLHGPFV